LTNTEHYNELPQNDIERLVHDCVEQVQQCVNDVNNLNSVSRVVTHYSPIFGVVNKMGTNCNGLKAKPGKRKELSNGEVSACNKSQYWPTCRMCGISFRAVHLLKEHALDIHRIKYVVVKGNAVEDSMGNHPESDILDFIDNEHMEPKKLLHNSFTQQLSLVEFCQNHLPQTQQILTFPFMIVGLIANRVTGSLSSKESFMYTSMFS
jgi:hypothetical protein